ncbi:MAG: hypothetical protein WB987_08910 [Candidatus Acidiferrales bacterium]
MAKKRSNRKKKSASGKKPARKAKVTRRTKKQTKAKKLVRRKRRSRSTEPTEKSIASIHQGVGLAEGGQSGDLQGLSGTEDVDSESVRELAEEGQDFEASIVDAIENAPNADASEVKTREVPEDDVPEEYRNQD